MLLKKIVVAEDDDAIAHMVSMALGDAGYLCLRAHDGEEALKIVRTHAPDLLVLDVMMPRLDGLGVAKRLKADDILSKIPILMLTALGDVEAKIKGFESGADDYLPKPFDLREFSARVNALIRQSRRERDRNPTTDLPGAGAVDEHIQEILSAEQATGVMHVTVSGFDDVVDAHGYPRGEELIGQIGKAVHSVARASGSNFVGHLGGIDFIVMSPSLAEVDTIAESIVSELTKRLSDWSKDIEMQIVVGVALTAGVTDDAVLTAGLAEAVRDAKQTKGTRHVVWTKR